MGVPGIVPLPRSAARLSPTVTEDEVEVQVGMAEGVGARIGAQDEELTEGGETKLIANPRELMSRQQIQPSFKADAPVSLEQVGCLCVVAWMSLVDISRPMDVPFRFLHFAFVLCSQWLRLFRLRLFQAAVYGGWVPLIG